MIKTLPNSPSAFMLVLSVFIFSIPMWFTVWYISDACQTVGVFAKYYYCVAFLLFGLVSVAYDATTSVGNGGCPGERRPMHALGAANCSVQKQRTKHSTLLY